LSGFKSLSPELKRNFGMLFGAGLLFWASLTTLLPIMPLYVKSLGGTKQDIGFVMGAFAIGLLVFRNQLGRLADERGRKIVLLIGIVVVAIAPLGYLVTSNIHVLLAWRAFHGLSVAAFALGYAALVSDLAPDDHRGEIIGYMSLVNPVGVAIGPAIGGLLQAHYGFAETFLLAFGLGAVGLGFTWGVEAPQPQHLDASQTPASQSQPFWVLLGSPRIRTPGLVLLLIGFIFGTLITFLPLLIQEHRLNFNVGYFYTAAALASFTVRLLIGQASDRYGRGIFISIGLGCYTLAMLILRTVPDPPWILCAGILEGMGGGIFIPMMVALMSDRSSAHERGRVLSLSLSGFDVGMGLAGPILGVFADQLGYSGLFSLSTGFGLLALIIFASQSGKTWHDSFNFAIGTGKDVYAIANRKP
jgi:MFS family permease